ncbi:Uncharacterised protein [Mycobacteroides abscessus subsp. massiliense]|mgnify:CR=1 FL=1|uniref:hypothetical protein n=1 Tax=Mycobacteroides abscessus TaxID=36809 RepID=UPI0009A74C73|nr:hypothetical protein [Mycobacteroides abscessus]SKM24476.1 Uncharacterised protein [Mycobacteroides abscessus subsp. massiliense]SKM72346.1 Uncharacterised protein [Mycobacteroides abscessus subsp. massiliense]SKN08718.1 Uncharacterised protein [Mycobacteroides abscessus subsp. massiliense]SKN16332.1 Uncharacterised protein [Mycobacteroides abscessus subsp. massiliense]SKN26032.1 Uncharacterised protein [Mycobacteroides abscessus subsp. massiliense]
MTKIDLFPRCEESLADRAECGAVGAARIEDPDNGINEQFLCEQHMKEYLWAECRREASGARSTGATIKLRLRDLT